MGAETSKPLDTTDIVNILAKLTNNTLSDLEKEQSIKCIYFNMINSMPDSTMHRDTLYHTLRSLIVSFKDNYILSWPFIRNNIIPICLLSEFDFEIHEKFLQLVINKQRNHYSCKRINTSLFGTDFDLDKEMTDYVKNVVAYLCESNRFSHIDDFLKQIVINKNDIKDIYDNHSTYQSKQLLKKFLID